MAAFEHDLLEQLSEKYRPLNAAFVSVLGGIEIFYSPQHWCSYTLLAFGFGFVLIGLLKVSAKIRVSLMSVLFAHTLGVALICQLNAVVLSILVLIILTQVLSLLGPKQGLPLLTVSALLSIASVYGLHWMGLAPNLDTLAIVDTSHFSMTNQWISSVCAFVYVAVIAIAHESVIREHFIRQMRALSKSAETLQTRLGTLEKDHYELFRKMPSMTVMCDQDKNIVVASDSFLRATGYVLEDLLQKKLSQLFAAQDQVRESAWAETLQRTGRTSCQTRLLTANGEALHVHCAMSLSKLQSTHSTAYLLVIS
jgi:PAS domain S-box-containing protein